ncbi:hypothetical protein SAMN06265348_1333 [Pedobacter westerhofensis]|uniref:Uncharacterized protein n=1 Tax=Pedobacter westerhofensis TaxID=425512 RepID=A0A521FV40_9SPHI|nr:hypothetical protein SAMN06265348_1333 [Pedobacter westerhofensis]
MTVHSQPGMNSLQTCSSTKGYQIVSADAQRKQDLLFRIQIDLLFRQRTDTD